MRPKGYEYVGLATCYNCKHLEWNAPAPWVCKKHAPFSPSLYGCCPSFRDAGRTDYILLRALNQLTENEDHEA